MSDPKFKLMNLGKVPQIQNLNLGMKIVILNSNN